MAGSGPDAALVARRLLLGLLVLVVAGRLAEGLEVGGIEEAGAVAAVSGHVIADEL